MRPVVGHDLAAGGGDLVRVGTDQFAPVGGQHPLTQQGVVAGPPEQRGLGGDEAYGAAHQGAHHRPAGQRVREFRGG